MTLVNKSQIVMEWLMGCSEIKDLFFGFSKAENGKAMIIPTPDENWVTQYIDGSGEKVYELVFIAYQNFSDVPNSLENTNIQYDLEKIMNWVEEQNDKGNFPAIENVQEVRCLENMPNLSGVSEQCAKYMFTIQIKYTVA